MRVLLGGNHSLGPTLRRYHRVGNMLRRLEQYPQGLNHSGSILADAIALILKKIEHLFPLDLDRKAIQIERKML
jgi:hypothetical protein